MQHQRQTMPEKNAAQVEAIKNHVSFVRRKSFVVQGAISVAVYIYCEARMFEVSVKARLHAAGRPGYFRSIFSHN